MHKRILKEILPSRNHFIKELKEKLIEFGKAPNIYLGEILKNIKGMLITIPNYPVIRRIDKKINFYFDFFYDYRVHKMYCGTYQLPLIKILKKYLKLDDVFIDVGANIGYISAIGAELVGIGGEVHSFEPVPIYFNNLLKVANLNKDYNIFVNNYALGESNGTANIRISNLNIGWNTMVSRSMMMSKKQETRKVKVIRLDDYLFKKNIENVSLIKVDVEGFEYFVLKGLTNFFEQKMNLPKIIVEIRANKYPKTIQSLLDLDLLMTKYCYKAYTIINEKPIDIKKLRTTTDVLFKQNR